MPAYPTYVFYGKQLYGEYLDFTNAAAEAPDGAFLYAPNISQWFGKQYGWYPIKDLEEIPKDIRTLALLL